MQYGSITTERREERGERREERGERREERGERREERGERREERGERREERGERSYLRSQDNTRFHTNLQRTPRALGEELHHKSEIGSNPAQNSIEFERF